MTLTLVDSAALNAVAYDADSGILQLQFRDRRIYQYSGVPAAVYEGLLRAESHGAFFNRAIRRHFPYAPGSPSGTK